MARVAVCGGGVIGMASAMMLARDGHEVTVLERDPHALPESPMAAWERWERPGVPQFRQPHNLFPRYRQILEEELPDVLDGLISAGGSWVHTVATLPPSIEDQSPRPDDDRFRFVTGRRPMVELVHAQAAAAEPGVTVRRGAKIEGFLTDGSRNGSVHVTGVRAAGEEIPADLVVDAMGRRSPAADWIEAAGGRRPIVSSQESGFTYYTRYFQGPTPPVQIAPTVSTIGTFLILTLPGDNDTWSVTLWAPTGDHALKAFRDPERFEAVLRACPLHAHWLEGEPVSDVLAMGGILDRYRRFVVDDEPVATGFAAVGDAWACTNPSAGRGLSVGLIHAQRLRDVARKIEDLDEFAREWDAVTEAELAPWYWNQLAADEARLTRINALREGRDEGIDLLAPVPPRYEAATRAMLHDADVFRAVMETVGCLALPDEVFARPGLWEKVEAKAKDPLVLPGPNREELLALLA